MVRSKVKHLHATVPAELLEEFRKLVYELHPKTPYGALGYELTLAMEAHIQKMRTRTQNTNLSEKRKNTAEPSWKRRIRDREEWELAKSAEDLV